MRQKGISANGKRQGAGVEASWRRARAGAWQRPRSRRDERRRGSQRGEPQHAGDEQQRHLGGLRDFSGRPARGAAQHPLLQRARGLDAHQRHPQPGHVHAAACREGDALRDPRPGQGPAPHALGADRLRNAVHRGTQVPQHFPRGAVPPDQLLHQVRRCALPGEHNLSAQRPPAQTAAVPRCPYLRYQQVLRPLKEPLQLHQGLGKVPPAQSCSMDPVPLVGIQPNPSQRHLLQVTPLFQPGPTWTLTWGQHSLKSSPPQPPTAPC